MKAHGHALWLMLPEEAERRYAALIGELARRHGGPVFAPHVTLLSGLDGEPEALLAAARELAAAIPAVEIRLGRLYGTESYFHCLYLEAEPTPTLAAARERALARFGRGEDGFLPHLSLLYGRLELKAWARTVDALPRPLEGAYTSTRLQLVRVEGEVREWRVVGEAPLGS